MLTDSLRERVLSYTADLRRSFGRAAINQRILHRLSVADRAELSRLGLTAEDVSRASRPDVADAATFLLSRRDARRQDAG